MTRSMKIPAWTTIVFAMLFSTCWARTWTNREGKMIEAELVSFHDGIVKIKRSDGKVFDLTMDKLSDEDQKFVKTAPQDANSEPADEDQTDLEELGPGMLGTRTVLGEEGKFYRVYPGSHVQFADGGPQMDYPGSLLFIGEGGLTIQGKKLLEGKIYHFNDKKEPQLSKAGEYSVWISYSRDASIFSEKAEKGRRVAEVKAGEKLELLFAGQEPKGWHKVRTIGQPKAEGWINGKGWDKTFFMKHKRPETTSEKALEATADQDFVRSQANRNARVSPKSSMQFGKSLEPKRMLRKLEIDYGRNEAYKRSGVWENGTKMGIPGVDFEGVQKLMDYALQSGDYAVAEKALKFFRQRKMTVNDELVVSADVMAALLTGKPTAANIAKIKTADRIIAIWEILDNSVGVNAEMAKAAISEDISAGMRDLPPDRFATDFSDSVSAGAGNFTKLNALTAAHKHRFERAQGRPLLDPRDVAAVTDPTSTPIDRASAARAVLQKTQAFDFALSAIALDGDVSGLYNAAKQSHENGQIENAALVASHSDLVSQAEYDAAISPERTVPNVGRTVEAVNRIRGYDTAYRAMILGADPELIKNKLAEALVARRYDALENVATLECAKRLLAPDSSDLISKDDLANASDSLHDPSKAALTEAALRRVAAFKSAVVALSNGVSQEVVDRVFSDALATRDYTQLSQIAEVSLHANAVLLDGTPVIGANAMQAVLSADRSDENVTASALALLRVRVFDMAVDALARGVDRATVAEAINRHDLTQLTALVEIAKASVYGQDLASPEEIAAAAAIERTTENVALTRAATDRIGEFERAVAKVARGD